MTELLVTDEQLAAVADEMAALRTQRLNVLAEIGEKALPELRANPEFSALAAQVGQMAEKLDALKLREAELIKEKERREKEERERLLKLTCFTCKTVNSEGAKYCENCGGKLGEPPREYCMACGTMNSPNMKFCGECGSRLEEVKAQ